MRNKHFHSPMATPKCEGSMFRKVNKSRIQSEFGEFSRKNSVSSNIFDDSEFDSLQSIFDTLCSEDEVESYEIQDFD